MLMFIRAFGSKQQSDFMVYSTYCNSYPRALMELETYTGNSNAMVLLEKYVFDAFSHILCLVFSDRFFLCVFDTLLMPIYESIKINSVPV